ncbi:20268_t:CDS:2 [Racocetra persica]|uniref:20268_t:CDS:1 n=1 Tax=Racocetra persica TaxID=160502 RepID=A0ACA9L3L5_9GLOM|nr:20268_t:CDS:2 [Racocetra persica]
MSMKPPGWCNDCEIHSITLKRYEKLVQQKMQQLADIEDEDILVQEKIRLTQQDIRKIRAHETKDRNRRQEFIIRSGFQNENTIFESINNDNGRPLRGASNALQEIKIYLNCLVPPATKSYRPLVPAAHISNIPPSLSQELLRTTLEKEFGKVLGLTVWEYHVS